MEKTELWKVGWKCRLLKAVISEVRGPAGNKECTLPVNATGTIVTVLPDADGSGTVIFATFPEIAQTMDRVVLKPEWILGLPPE